MIPNDNLIKPYYSIYNIVSSEREKTGFQQNIEKQKKEVTFFPKEFQENLACLNSSNSIIKNCSLTNISTDLVENCDKVLPLLKEENVIEILSLFDESTLRYKAFFCICQISYFTNQFNFLFTSNDFFSKIMDLLSIVSPKEFRMLCLLLSNIFIDFSSLNPNEFNVFINEDQFPGFFCHIGENEIIKFPEYYQALINLLNGPDCHIHMRVLSLMANFLKRPLPQICFSEENYTDERMSQKKYPYECLYKEEMHCRKVILSGIRKLYYENEHVETINHIINSHSLIKAFNESIMNFSEDSKSACESLSIIGRACAVSPEFAGQLDVYRDNIFKNSIIILHSGLENDKISIMHCLSLIIDYYTNVPPPGLKKINEINILDEFEKGSFEYRFEIMHLLTSILHRNVLSWISSNLSEEMLDEIAEMIDLGDYARKSVYDFFTALLLNKGICEELDKRVGQIIEYQNIASNAENDLTNENSELSTSADLFLKTFSNNS